MEKKYIFLDLDGTIIDHETNSVPDSTISAIKRAQANGHELFICTGRIPGLFHGIDKTLNIHNYIAANGKLVVIHDEIVYNRYMSTAYVDEFVQYANDKQLDVAFESFDEYVLNSYNSKTTDQFLEKFHLEKPHIIKDFHKNNSIYQMNLMYTGDFSELKETFPHFHFSQANEFGLDILEGAQMKEEGVEVVVNHLNIDLKDTIAIGDGYNDISMIKYVNTGIAMGNANSELKEAADFTTNDVTHDGIYHAFIKLGLIEKD